VRSVPPATNFQPFASPDPLRCDPSPRPIPHRVTTPDAYEEFRALAIERLEMEAEFDRLDKDKKGQLDVKE
jgi:hypothetical protein